MTITVMGATGRTGRRIAEQLLKRGTRIRALGRAAEKLAPLKALGAEVMAGDATDSDYLTLAFHGVDAIYTLLPYEVHRPDYHATQDRQGQAIATAIRASGARRVVFLSSLGAEQSSGTGMILSLHAQEQRLQGIDGLDALILRPGSFFENFHGAMALIKNHGLHCDAVRADLALPMIGAQDIADAAVAALLDRDWHGHLIRELLGPRDLSYAEATRLIGQRIGQPGLAYVQVSYDEMAQGLKGSGFSDDVAHLYAEIAKGINEGLIRSLAGRCRATTTPTSFEDFTAEIGGSSDAM